MTRARTRVAALTALTLAGLSCAVAPAQAASASGVTVVPGAMKELRLGDYDPGAKLLYTPRSAAPEGRSSANIVTATFQVNYDSGFQSNDAARNAFQRAVDIWSENVTSSVPILIDASFRPLPPGVLGSAGSPFLVFNTPNAQPNTGYSQALANALSGTDNVPDNSDPNNRGQDIDATFPSNFPDFYFGTDGNPGQNQIDFVSVVLHEIGHGLGFFGSGRLNADPDDGQATIGYVLNSGQFLPVIYDRFTEDGLNRSFIDSSVYPRPSTELRQGLEGKRGGGAFFDGPKTNFANGGTPARLFAPAPFQTGSSYSHFDEATYNGTVNRLMTPSFARGEVAQSPGPLMLCLFEDTGWTTPEGCAAAAEEPPPPVVPEVGAAVLLPLAALATIAAVFGYRRRSAGVPA